MTYRLYSKWVQLVKAGGAKGPALRKALEELYPEHASAVLAVADPEVDESESAYERVFTVLEQLLLT